MTTSIGTIVLIAIAHIKKPRIIAKKIQNGTGPIGVALLIAEQGAVSNWVVSGIAQATVKQMTKLAGSDGLDPILSFIVPTLRRGNTS